MGVPRKVEITDQTLAQMERLSGLGLNYTQIAHVLGISDLTLRRYREVNPAITNALEAGKAKAQAVVGDALFNRAKTGDVAAIRWWEMTRANRSEKQEIEQKTIQYVIEAPKQHNSEEAWEDANIIGAEDA